MEQQTLEGISTELDITGKFFSVILGDCDAFLNDR